MSEFPTFNLVLGIIGTITGVVALLVSYWTYRNAKPRLKVTLKRAEHIIDKKLPNSVGFTFVFTISNRGDRGTTLNEIEMSYTDNGKLHSQKKEIQHGYGTLINDVQKVNVNPHETIDRLILFDDDMIEEPPKKTMDFSFILYHTHGAFKFKATSKLTPK
jgi:hypothetical protein